MLATFYLSSAEFFWANCLWDDTRRWKSTERTMEMNTSRDTDISKGIQGLFQMGPLA